MSGPPPGEDLFKWLSCEVADYIPSSVPRIAPPSPLEFYREYVDSNRPCIVTGLYTHAGRQVALDLFQSLRCDALTYELNSLRWYGSTPQALSTSGQR